MAYSFLNQGGIDELVLIDIDKAKAEIPILPAAMREEYLSLGISTNNINTLIAVKELNDFYRPIYKETDAIILANLLTGDILSHLNKNNINLNDTKLTNEKILGLVNLLSTKKITSKQGKEILPHLLTSDKLLDEIIKELGITEVDDSALKEIINKVLSLNEQSVNDYKAGKEKAIKYLIGQVMKESKGQANPEVVNNMLIDTISNN